MERKVPRKLATTSMTNQHQKWKNSQRKEVKTLHMGMVKVALVVQEVILLPSLQFWALSLLQELLHPLWAREQLLHSVQCYQLQQALNFSLLEQEEPYYWQRMVEEPFQYPSVPSNFIQREKGQSKIDKKVHKS